MVDNKKCGFQMRYRIKYNFNIDLHLKLRNLKKIKQTYDFLEWSYVIGHHCWSFF